MAGALPRLAVRAVRAAWTPGGVAMVSPRRWVPINSSVAAWDIT